MTEMAPEQPIPDEEEAYDIKGTGKLRKGRYIVRGELGGVSLTLKVDRANEEQGELADILIRAFPQLVLAVVESIESQVSADE